MTITAKNIEDHDKAIDLMVKHRDEFGLQLVAALDDAGHWRKWWVEEIQRLNVAIDANEKIKAELKAAKSVTIPPTTFTPLNKSLHPAWTPGTSDVGQARYIPGAKDNMNMTKGGTPPWWMTRALANGVSMAGLAAEEVPSYPSGAKIPNDPTDPTYEHAYKWRAFETKGDWTYLEWDAERGNHLYHRNDGLTYLRDHTITS